MKPGWERTNVYDAATRIPRTRVQLDRDGAEARLFGGFTSGQTFLYDEAGRLRYAGGVTSLRGHAGLNRGRMDVIRIARKRSGEGSHPVFGCAITTTNPRRERRCTRSARPPRSAGKDDGGRLRRACTAGSAQ